MNVRRLTYSETVVHDVTQITVEDMLYTCADRGFMAWCRGVLLTENAIESELTVQLSMLGIEHTAHVVFAKLPTYVSVLSTNANMSLPVIDVSSNRKNRAVVEWLKTQPEWNDTIGGVGA